MLLAPSTLPMIERATTVDGELALDVFERCRGGDRTALTQFVQHYERRVLALLSRALGARPRIDDLAQEVFIRAYQNIHKFDPGGTARLSTWLLTIPSRLAAATNAGYGGMLTQLPTCHRPIQAEENCKVPCFRRPDILVRLLSHLLFQLLNDDAQDFWI